MGGSRRARDRKFNKRRVQFEQQKKLKDELYDCTAEEEQENKAQEQENKQVNTNFINYKTRTNWSCKIKKKNYLKSIPNQ